MSHPDPKAWEEPDDDPEILAFAYRIARRRALAELRALRQEQHGERGDHDTYRVVPVDAITARIAAIEAEEATPFSASE